MSRMGDRDTSTAYMDKPAQMLMETLKMTLGMWANEIADDAAKKACERAHKLARERVAKALGEWAAKSQFQSTVDYQAHSMRITLVIPFATIQASLGGQNGFMDLLQPPKDPEL